MSLEIRAKSQVKLKSESEFNITWEFTKGQSLESVVQSLIFLNEIDLTKVFSKESLELLLKESF